jgi:sulfur carrier protein
MMTITINGETHQLSAGSSVADVLAELNLGTGRVAVEVNKLLVTRTDHATHILKDGDQLEIVTLVGGG